MTGQFAGSENQRAHPAGRVREDPTADRDRIVLAASVEPSIVFASFAAHCVLRLCDEATIDIIDGLHAPYRIVSSPRDSSGRVLRIVDRAASAADCRVRLPFARRRAADAVGGDALAIGVDDFHGVATLVWHHRTPTRAERMTATVLIEHAVQTVVWQRSEHAVSIATAKAANLTIALQTSRHIGAAIGILMSLHKVTEDQAFELLRDASQRSNRKLRDLAMDVIDTGCLDPTLPTSLRHADQTEHIGPSEGYP